MLVTVSTSLRLRNRDAVLLPHALHEANFARGCGTQSVRIRARSLLCPVFCGCFPPCSPVHHYALGKDNPYRALSKWTAFYKAIEMWQQDQYPIRRCSSLYTGAAHTSLGWNIPTYYPGRMQVAPLPCQRIVIFSSRALFDSHQN